MEEDEKDIRSAIENPKYKPQRVAPRKGKITLCFIEPLSISISSSELDPESSLINLTIKNMHPVNDLCLLNVNLSMNSTARDFDGDSSHLGTKGKPVNLKRPLSPLRDKSVNLKRPLSPLRDKSVNLNRPPSP